MKRMILFILIVLSNSSYSQENNLVLHFQVQKNFLTSNYDLILGDSITIWKETSDPSQIEFNPTYISEEDYSRKTLFKNQKSKSVFSDYDILGAEFFVKDSLYNQSWVLIDSKPEELLGYNCNKAKTTFRGRDYEVLYTSEIPINNGPWKFGGLPGMILKVVAQTNDEIYIMECIGIEKHDYKTEDELANYLKKRKRKKFQSWGEFVIDFNSFLDRYIKSIKSEVEVEGDSGFTLHFSVDNHLEIFSKEVQTDGILLEF